MQRFPLSSLGRICESVPMHPGSPQSHRWSQSTILLWSHRDMTQFLILKTPVQKAKLWSGVFQSLQVVS